MSDDERSVFPIEVAISQTIEKIQDMFSSILKLSAALTIDHKPNGVITSIEQQVCDANNIEIKI